MKESIKEVITLLTNKLKTKDELMDFFLIFVIRSKDYMINTCKLMYFHQRIIL